MHLISKISSCCINKIIGVQYKIKQNIIECLGKRVKIDDFRKLMHFWYHSKIASSLPSENILQPFSYSIKRDDISSVEGKIQLFSNEQNKKEVVNTFVQKIPKHKMNQKINFQLSSASNIVLAGDTFLHGWLEYEFNSIMRKEFTLQIEPATFGTFIVLIGNFTYENQFEPTYAKIVIKEKQNTPIEVPIQISKIPSLRQFKKSIQSLSNNQKDFSILMRDKTLSTSLLGVCIIQVKPQLEKLLKLPSYFLTKEIRFTYKLIKLFTQFNIPSDLLSIPSETSTLHSSVTNELQKNIDYVENMIHDYCNTEYDSFLQQYYSIKQFNILKSEHSNNHIVGKFELAMDINSKKMVRLLRIKKSEYNIDSALLNSIIVNKQKPKKDFLQEIIGFIDSDVSYFWIIFEYFDLTLNHILQSRKLYFSIGKWIFYEICTMIQKYHTYVDSTGYKHLNADNVLLLNDGRIFLRNMSFLSALQHKNRSFRRVTDLDPCVLGAYSTRSPIYYSVPEEIRYKSPRTFGGDIWTLGILFMDIWNRMGDSNYILMLHSGNLPDYNKYFLEESQRNIVNTCLIIDLQVRKMPVVARCEEKSRKKIVNCLKKRNTCFTDSDNDGKCRTFKTNDDDCWGFDEDDEDAVSQPVTQKSTARISERHQETPRCEDELELSKDDDHKREDELEISSDYRFTHSEKKYLTEIPSQLDENFEQLNDVCMNSISVSSNCSIDQDTLDLLDTLSSTGALELQNSTFHVLIGASHSWDESVFNTLLKKNENPFCAAEKTIEILINTLKTIVLDK